MENAKEEAPVETYDRMYEEEGAYDLPYRKSFYYPLFDRVRREVEAHGTRELLEVGCGSGSLAQMLFDHTDIRYRGFDFSAVAVDKARDRCGNPDLFAVADARDPGVYGGGFDTIVCTEVLEHIDADLEVIGNWPTGTYCVCSVPNFDYPTHVRLFRTEAEVQRRYGDAIDIARIARVARPVFRGLTAREYLRKLRWSRDDPKKFLALLGYRTFDNLAGWFVFCGVKT